MGASRRQFLTGALLAPWQRDAPVVYDDGRSRIRLRLGERRTLIDDGQYGLRYFPDGAMAVFQRRPEYRVLLAAEVSSYLLVGPSMDQLKPVAKVLAPGKPGSFDNGYAGIGGAVVGEKSGRVYAFYHAEDWEGLGMIGGGIHGFYCTVAQAISEDNGLTFRRLGPVITSHIPKQAGGRIDQGCGEMTVLADKDSRYLLCYYTDHSHIGNRGSQICLARCPLPSYGKAGSWLKYFEGDFGEPGLGGQDMGVIRDRPRALEPQVSYSLALGKYVMFFNVINPDSGVYVAFSDDGIQWSRSVQVIQGHSIPVPDQDLIWHATMIWDGESPAGWLYCSYSPRWGNGDGRKSHYLVGQPAIFTVERHGAL
jgi:hypothetical protein